jgi:hypothetical protein
LIRATKVAIDLADQHHADDLQRLGVRSRAGRPELPASLPTRFIMSSTCGPAAVDQHARTPDAPQ